MSASGSLFLLYIPILIVYAWVRTRGKGTKEFIEMLILFLTIASATYLLARYSLPILAGLKGWIIQENLLELLSLGCSLLFTAVCWKVMTKAAWTAKAEKALIDAVKLLQAAANSMAGSADRAQGATSEIEQFRKDFEQSLRDFKREIETEVTDDLNKVRAEIPPAAPGISEEEINRIVERFGEVVHGATDQREGIRFQDESAQDFEVLGFGVVNSEGRDKPDHLLYVGTKAVAVGSAKTLLIRGSWPLNPERVGKAEVDDARKRNLPLVVHLMNKENWRKWIVLIEPEEVKKNFKITAPSWLWKPELNADEEREMEANHREAGEHLRQLRDLGARTRNGRHDK
jgi:hypothetical protein